MNWFEYPITSSYQDHINSNRTAGVDYGTPINIPIITLYAGTVSNFEEPPPHKGRYVDIEWDDTKWRFLHLNDFVKNTGDIVKIGDVIGISGNTGWTTGPHTHIEVQKFVNGKWVRVDPMPYIHEGINNLYINNTAMRDWFVQGRKDLQENLKNDKEVINWLNDGEANRMQVIDTLYKIGRADVIYSKTKDKNGKWVENGIRSGKITLYEWLSKFGTKEIPGGIWSQKEVELYKSSNCSVYINQIEEIKKIVNV